MSFLNSFKRMANRSIKDQGRRANKILKERGDEMTPENRKKAEQMAEYANKNYFETSD